MTAQFGTGDMRLISVLFLFLYLVVLSSGATRFPMAKPGCRDTCGTVTIPYPFGIGPGCALNQAYTINCTDGVDSSMDGSRPYLTIRPQGGSLQFRQVLEVSLRGQTVTINTTTSAVCWDQGQVDLPLLDPVLNGTPFLYSPEHDKLMLVGCGNVLLTLGFDSPEILSGCTSMCSGRKTPGCYGINCCQASFPYYISQYSLNLTASQNLTSRTCSYALFVDQKWNLDDYLNPLKDPFFPVVWSWTLPNYSDIDAISGCSPKNSSLQLESGNISSYQCECRTLGGDTWFYQINPYLDGACQEGATIGAGVLIFMIIISISYNALKKRWNNRRKEKFFKRMLQQQLPADDIENTKLFTAKELSKATDGFNNDRILGRGGQGTVYKGMLTDGRIIAIKKAKNVDDSRFEEFVNEVVILSQLNHRNVVKLLGCCLETEVPLLVYEFIPNGTLYSLIHNQNDDEFPFTWNLRLRIASEIAGALAYLHSQISVPILHRDVKSSNVLLDEKYIAKVADFGTSKTIEVDKTHLTTAVKGTFGYLDPEYFHTSHYTDKGDVYGFGVVLVELITRQKPISSTPISSMQTGEDNFCMSLVERFLKSMNQNSLQTILDSQLVDERYENEVIFVAKLARQCLNSTGKMRPTMREILLELESIKLSKRDSTIDTKFQSPSCIENLADGIVGNTDTYCTWTSGSDTVESSSDAHPFL
ncbi:wall-associated receptor kinase-like 1 [Coffea eugenioides]|uniref:wall-associated receptor kinase-like 1 n=1 Tax=Coffea eugenioides TaxID=49369 RepID=UPI000F60524D|nr:wall-associated receptor kinase-like 1 [Coffea eugenioides]